MKENNIETMQMIDNLHDNQVNMQKISNIKLDGTLQTVREIFSVITK